MSTIKIGREKRKAKTYTKLGKLQVFIVCFNNLVPGMYLCNSSVGLPTSMCFLDKVQDGRWVIS